MRDPYAVLGVPKTASEKDIKSAFRKLAKTYHPDTNPGNAAAGTRFNEANQAYEILGDKDKREKFDRGEIDAEGKPRFQGFPGGNGGGPFGGGGSGTFGGGGGGGFDFRGGGDGQESVFADIFEQAFGGARGARGGGGRGGFSAARNASMRGEDLRANLKVRLEDVVSDEKVEAIFPSGKRLAIRLPAGVEDGQVIRLRGQGQPAPVAGGEAGDALVTVEFLSHPRFRAEGRDLRLDLDVPLETAVLGGSVPVDALDGRVSLRVPAWTTSGRTFRLKGKGLSTKAGGRGDILASVRIALASGPDPELANFLQARRDASAG